MWVMPPPDHLHGDRRGAPQRPEDDTIAPVLRRQAVPARFFGVFMSVNPVFAALTGVIVLSQSLALADWLAIAAIVTANAASVSTGGPVTRRRLPNAIDPVSRPDRASP
jgi:inner membrane transporter RhtA